MIVIEVVDKIPENVFVWASHLFKVNLHFLALQEHDFYPPV